MGTRQDVSTSTVDRDRFLAACVEMSDDTSADLTSADVNRLLAPQVPGWQMRGITIDLSWWDLYVLWHYTTMQLATSGVGANRAHGGPVFLPWHRLYLLRLEQEIQRRSGDPNFGLPYWDWAADRQLSNSIWQHDQLGVNRGDVVTGSLANLRVRLTGRWTPTTGAFLEAHEPRPIWRAAGQDPQASRLPRKAQVATCLAETSYDNPTYDINASGFRNHLEGWVPNPPGLHNLVHVWVGGDMGPGTSPNDPVFYLNHCNVDRIWEAWMTDRGRVYAPIGGGPVGHNIDDPLVALLGQPMTPRQLLDPSPWYDYDNLAVTQ